MYLNEPEVCLEIGKPNDTCPYRVRINGDTMECRDIAKLIIDNWVVSYPDPYIKIPSVRTPEELNAWRSKLGLSAFSDIWRVVSDNANDMIDLFSKAELKSDNEIEKAKKLIEMQVAKETYEKRKELEEKERKAREEMERREQEEREKYLANLPMPTEADAVKLLKVNAMKIAKHEKSMKKNEQNYIKEQEDV
jgi:hypothetical protein